MAFNVISLVVPVQSKDAVVFSVLLIETVVEFIQLGFYSWFRNSIISSPLTVTPLRYYDWVITTPLMLFTTIVFFKYNSQTEEELEKEPLSLSSFLQKYSSETLLILGFNLVMLLAGYFAELNVVSLFTSTVLGFLAFGGTFYTMWDVFVKDVPQNFILYGLMTFIWGLYGIAALFGPVWKNISYNILDIFSKNFYGVFLSIYIILRYARKV
jgi:hypothetical protein